MEHEDCQNYQNYFAYMSHFSAPFERLIQTVIYLRIFSDGIRASVHNYFIYRVFVYTYS